MPQYVSPDVTIVTDHHIRCALNFLVAIEPVPASDTHEEYEAAIAPYREQASAAIRTIRRFAEQGAPQSLDEMQAQYHGFTNDPHYLTTSEVSSVVTSSLNEAWAGIGPWRR